MSVLIGFLIALVAGIVTTAVYAVIVWRLDRYEKEPPRLLALAFAWGMIPATLISIIVELMLDLPMNTMASQGAALFSQTISAPIVEESAKGLALLAFLVFAYREVDDVLDGIVYGAMVGFGFAFSENVLYVVSSVAEGGLAAGLLVLFLRMVVFGTNHAFFTSLTGAGVGEARLRRGLARRLPLLLGGWLLAIVFHGLHNLGAALAESTGALSLLLSALADWGGLLGLLILVLLAWRKEERWMREELASEVGIGTLSAEEYAAVSSNTGRQRLLAGTLRRSGWAAYQRLVRLYALFTELAYKKRQVRLLGDENGTWQEIPQLRAAIQKEREQETA